MKFNPGIERAGSLERVFEERALQVCRYFHRGVSLSKCVKNYYSRWSSRNSLMPQSPIEASTRPVKTVRIIKPILSAQHPKSVTHKAQRRLALPSPTRITQVVS